MLFHRWHVSIEGVKFGAGDFELVTSKDHWPGKLVSACVHFWKVGFKPSLGRFWSLVLKDDLRNLLFKAHIPRCVQAFANFISSDYQESKPWWVFTLASCFVWSPSEGHGLARSRHQGIVLAHGSSRISPLHPLGPLANYITLSFI